MAVTCRPHGISFPDDLYRRIQLAASGTGMSASAFICAASEAAIQSLFDNDAGFRLYVLSVEERERAEERARVLASA